MTLPRLRRFRDSETASLSVEAVLVVPFLVWAFLGLFTITDAFRTVHANTISAYTIGDALSRETDFVSPSYIEGLNDMHEIMTRSDGATDLRATLVHYDKNDQRYEVEWSYGTGDRTPLTTGSLSEIESAIPPLVHGEAVVVVETWMPYAPMVDYLVKDMEVYQAVATRPRYAPTIAWQE